jgi:hypothetical protein
MEIKDVMEDMELELFNTLKILDRLLKMLIHIKQSISNVLLKLVNLKLMESLN